MRTRESFLALITELEGDYREFLRIMDRNRRGWDRIAQGADDPLDWGALGFTLHNAYGVLENYFLRIAKFFEDNLPPDRWHRALVERMALEIPGIRPALFTDGAAKRGVLELLKFRHRIRNLYGEDLDPRKTSEVQGTAVDFSTRFAGIHADFLEKLRAIAEGLR
jgi:hypothetical protein